VAGRRRGALVLLLALIAGLTAGCAHRRLAVEAPLEAPPRLDTFDLRLRAYLDDTAVGETTLSLYLTDLEVEGCLVAEEGPLLEALEGLRRLHRRTYESLGTPGRLVVWEVWRGRLRHFSPDGRALVETYLDLPSRGRRFYFCDDDLPPSWRGLDAADFVSRARTTFAAEVEARQAGLEERGADGARVVEELRDLRVRIERRFDAQFDERDEHSAHHGELLAALDDTWYERVDPFDLGAPVLLVDGTVPPLVAVPATPAGEPATYADHPGAAMAGAGGGGAPGRDGFGIPDPIDVWRKDRVVRSWKRTRRLMRREAREMARLADEIAAELDATADPVQRERLLRELIRTENGLDHLYADLGRHWEKADAMRTGHAVADMLIGRARRKEDKRSRRTRRKMGRALEQTEEVVAQARREVLGEDAVAAGTGVGATAAAEPGNPTATGPVAGAGTSIPGVTVTADGNALVYEGPCPPPDAGWSGATVAALRAAYPFVDDTDARIFLALLERTYTSLSDRVQIEDVVTEHLERGIDLRLREGNAGDLSEIYDPTRDPGDQEILTFFVTLEL
jgi:hypothetical protein